MHKILRYRDLRSAGLGSRQTVWRAVRNGNFPQPIRVMGRPGWLAADVARFIDEQKAAGGESRDTTRDAP